MYKRDLFIQCDNQTISCKLRRRLIEIVLMSHPKETINESKCFSPLDLLLPFLNTFFFKFRTQIFKVIWSLLLLFLIMTFFKPALPAFACFWIPLTKSPRSITARHRCSAPSAQHNRRTWTSRLRKPPGSLDQRHPALLMAYC